MCKDLNRIVCCQYGVYTKSRKKEGRRKEERKKEERRRKKKKKKKKKVCNTENFAGIYYIGSNVSTHIGTHITSLTLHRDPREICVLQYTKKM